VLDVRRHDPVAETATQLDGDRQTTQAAPEKA
jgi:hypothetical protein